jgi:hypothetical protein
VGQKLAIVPGERGIAPIKLVADPFLDEVPPVVVVDRRAMSVRRLACDPVRETVDRLHGDLGNAESLVEALLNLVPQPATRGDPPGANVQRSKRGGMSTDRSAIPLAYPLAANRTPGRTRTDWSGSPPGTVGAE